MNARRLAIFEMISPIFHDAQIIVAVKLLRYITSLWLLVNVIFNFNLFKQKPTEHFHSLLRRLSPVAFSERSR